MFQNLVTDDKVLSIKSEINGIPVKNSTWLQQVAKVISFNDSSVVLGKSTLIKQHNFFLVKRNWIQLNNYRASGIR